MSKIDISEYYRNFPMAFHHWKDLAFKWKIFGNDFESILLETCMPFGLSPACGIGATFTSAVVRLMRSKGYTVVGYLDDFLVIGNTYEECLRGHEYLIWLLRDLGMPVNEDKCELPARNMIFLGVELSTELPFCTAGVDEARVNLILESINSLMQSSTVSAKKVESVLGLLTFVSQVIWGSRMFLRSAYHLLRAAQTKRGVRGFLTLSRKCLSDLKWWHRMVYSQGTRKMVLGIFLRVSNFYSPPTPPLIGVWAGFMDGILGYGLQFLGTKFARCAQTQFSLFGARLLATSTI